MTMSGRKSKPFIPGAMFMAQIDEEDSMRECEYCDATAKYEASLPKHVDIVFDGPPGPEAGRFVEVENDKRHSIGNFGEWVHRDDGYWVLRINPRRPMDKSYLDGVAAGENNLAHFLIEGAPDPLRRLGDRLGDLLDADHWNNIEPLLLDLAARMALLRQALAFYADRQTYVGEASSGIEADMGAKARAALA